MYLIQRVMSEPIGGHPFRQATIRRCRSNDLGLRLTGQNNSSQNLHRAIDLVLTPRGEAKITSACRRSTKYA